MSNTTIIYPTFSLLAAEQLAHQHFGINAKAKNLVSYSDQNFHLKDEKGEEYVLKIMNCSAEKEILQMQNAAMTFLHGKIEDFSLPKVYANTQGEDITEIEDENGNRYFLRLLSWVQGEIWEYVLPHTPELCEELGKKLAKMSQVFQQFETPHQIEIPKEWHWNVANPIWIYDNIALIEDEEDRDIFIHFLIHYKENLFPNLDKLREGFIHNDANTFNLLVNTQEEMPKIAGLIDFGEMTTSKIVCELAVPCAYLAMNYPDPLAIVAPIVKGFHSVFPLNDAEMRAIFPMMANRIMISLLYSAANHKNGVESEYLYVSEKIGWELLRKMRKISPNFAYYYFRNACGLEPNPNSAKVVNWLEKNAASFDKIISPDIRNTKNVVLDLSIGSTFLGNYPDFEDVKAVSRKINELIEQENAAFAIGKYNEYRPIYTSSIFEVMGNKGKENRTLHLGIDIFAPAETTVFAPLEGEIFGFANNEGDKDYGPTIILKHQTLTEGGEEICFYTLYGHLSEESLEFLETGMKIPKGFAVGQIGDYPTNGNWSPHLHFQVITDMLGNKWEFAGVALPSEENIWLNICPNPNLILQIPEEVNGNSLKKKSADAWEIRKKHLAKNLSLSYNTPLNIERGYLHYLYDYQGRAYLDTVNNVNQVGHQHPRIVEAAKRQLSVLNTNTRYLYNVLSELSEKLLATFPPQLKVCFFVNSGSEANELALRLAKNYTQGEEMLVMEQGYHGNTNACIEISSYKFEGKGGKGAAKNIHVLPMPDTFRGKYRANTPNAGVLYAKFAAEAIEKIKQQKGKKLAAFICESILSCGGQIVLPENYLAEVYKNVRNAGGVCIADEVQTGLGRVGKHFWGFELQNVVPDIVTIGKPFGNGHPVAAVVTTQTIADAFANGMEYFNTFGGNPVSCAVALEVLKVIEEEKLQENALNVGNYLQSQLHLLKNQFSIIGDVRGEGLFLGFELIKNLETLEAADNQATYLINQMKEQGVLMSTDGPLHNVIKIKPPIIFRQDNADFLVDRLEKVFRHNYMK